jgi:hypothetical protein
MQRCSIVLDRLLRLIPTLHKKHANYRDNQVAQIPLAFFDHGALSFEQSGRQIDHARLDIFTLSAGVRDEVTAASMYKCWVARAHLQRSD